LDPFFGAGTVGVVAERLGRRWCGIELSPTFGQMALERIELGRARQDQGERRRAA
jgi:site-specific DNA-methyltransferase (adenine-specific)/modification methylase